MATRLSPLIKVPVNFGNPADFADAVLTTLATPTIYIPENSVSFPVSFVSVILNIAYQDTSTVTGATITEFRAACTLSGAGASTITQLDDITNTGENIAGVLGPLDYTAYFNTNYGTVTSKTCQVQAYFDASTGTGLLTRGVYGWFEILYTFDDSAADRIKTIGYSLESVTGALTTTAGTTYGTIKQLTGGGGLLNGYSTPTIRYAWAEVSGNTSTVVVTNFNMSYSFDGGGASVLPTRENALQSCVRNLYQIDLSALSTGATHTIALWTSLAATNHNLCVTIYVTYSYAVSGTTRILNYLELPYFLSSNLEGPTSPDAQLKQESFIIAEPGTITQHNISIHTWSVGPSGPSFRIRAGSQAAYASYNAAGTTACGMWEYIHLVDSSSANGLGLTLARGKNNLKIDTYRAGGQPTAVCGIIRVLYESDVPSSGIDTAAKYCSKIMRQINTLGTVEVVFSGISFAIPETNYFINNAGVHSQYWSLNQARANVIEAEINSGEILGDGWSEFGTISATTDAELNYVESVYCEKTVFKKYPTDPIPRLDIEASRRIRFSSLSDVTRFGCKYMVNYHSITKTVSGSITNSTGGTVNIHLFTADTHELYASTSRVGNGSYSITVYDPVQQYYAVAYESNTLLGRSENGVGV